ncbi:phage major capsid protein [Eisenbergiella tayi]|uniref:Phage major capsid protein n=1 Tax=Eisenbergiella porci TaxID=2652274 RepID=A0A6N7WNK9_9FIRM|nr:phage major capsid protein [Eisenbergiella porci]MSS91365.1 phage major capsid protein [Eisenbergiella porci]
MNKKLLEMLDAIKAAKEKVTNLVNENKLEEAKAAKEELKNLQEQFDILKDVMDPEGTGEITDPGVLNGIPAGEKDSTKEFANAAREGFRNTMEEGVPADGGYTVPEDIQTRVNEYRSAKASLIELVDVENVTTNKGSRTFKKRAQQTGFSKVAEGGKIGAKPTPQFERQDYEIAKYAGYLPVTNELLADTDANITGTLVSWLGDESRVTRNNIILGVAKTKTKEAVAGLDDIKKVLNVTLGQAFKSTSRIVTNDDGLQWLDTLKNDKGEYLLQPNPADPMQMRLCAGATIIPVTVLPNQDFPSDTATSGHRKIPFLIGDLKEGIKFYDRNLMSIMTSNIAAIGSLNAFEEDLTIFRAIEREDCKIKDSEAFVYAEMDLSDASVTGE